MNKLFDISGFPALPKLNGVFVTGTDTEVGKTVISGAIAASLKSQGVNVDVFKPAASGCIVQSGNLISEDGAFLAACADSSRPLAEITPLRFERALAPNVAAQIENRDIDIDIIFEEYIRMAETTDTVVVEGVGGILCPISDHFNVLQFAAMTELPLVIVARPDLGTINHTLLTLQAARAAGLTVAGVIINQYRDEPYQSGQSLSIRDDSEIARLTNPKQISMLGDVEILTLVMQDDDTSVTDVKLSEEIMLSINSVDWLRIIQNY